MGAWDVGIFDNDTSADVRAFYESALLDDASTAGSRILEHFAEDLAEPEIAPDVWFGLAAAQWEYGRPEPEVVQRALAIIDDGSDLERWRALDAEEESVRERARALQDFAERLRSDPPPPSLPEPPRRRLPTTRFAVGDILAYELPSGRFVPLAVIQVPTTLTSGSAPICTFVPRALDEPPTLEAFMAMDIAEDPFREQQMLVSHDQERPALLGEVPPDVTFRALMLWLVHDSDEDEAHERDRVRVIGHADLEVSVVGHVQRVPWTLLAPYLEQQLALG